MSPRQLFIFGISRGGTNLLSSVINSSPDVVLAQDVLLPILNHWRSQALERLDAWNHSDTWPPAYPDYYFNEWGPAALQVLKSSPSTFRISRSSAKELSTLTSERASLENAQLAKLLVDLDFSTHSQGISAILSRVANRDTTSTDSLQWVGAKEVWSIDMLGYLAEAFPESKFFEISRDPRGVINSLAHLARTDPTQAAHIPSYLRHWRKHFAFAEYFSGSEKYEDRLLSIRYEKMLSDPVGTTRAIANFLEIHDRPMAEAMAGQTSLSNNSSLGSLDGRLTPDRGSAWVVELDDNLKKLVEFMVGPEMIVRGDLVSGSPWHSRDEDQILSHLGRLDRSPGKWRSDSGSPELEMRNESLRWELLRQQQRPLPSVAIRNYLDASLFDRCASAWQSER